MLQLVSLGWATLYFFIAKNKKYSLRAFDYRLAYPVMATGLRVGQGAAPPPKSCAFGLISHGRRLI